MEDGTAIGGGQVEDGTTRGGGGRAEEGTAEGRLFSSSTSVADRGARTCCSVYVCPISSRPFLKVEIHTTCTHV